MIVAKNRLFGKINLSGIVLDYDERSKRIYGDKDDLDYQFGWDRSDGFYSVEDGQEIPVRVGEIMEERVTKIYNACWKNYK